LILSGSRNIFEITLLEHIDRASDQEVRHCITRKRTAEGHRAGGELGPCDVAQSPNLGSGFDRMPAVDPGKLLGILKSILRLSEEDERRQVEPARYGESGCKVEWAVGIPVSTEFSRRFVRRIGQICGIQAQV